LFFDTASAPLLRKITHNISNKVFLCVGGTWAINTHVIFDKKSSIYEKISYKFDFVWADNEKPIISLVLAYLNISNRDIDESSALKCLNPTDTRTKACCYAKMLRVSKNAKR
jgi:hypothetical protein